MPFVSIDLDVFDEDDLVEYLEDSGYKVTKEDDNDLSGWDQDFNVTFNVTEYCANRLSNRVTARDFLTDILGLMHHASESEILERVKQVINQ